MKRKSGYYWIDLDGEVQIAFYTVPDAIPTKKGAMIRPWSIISNNFSFTENEVIVLSKKPIEPNF